MPKKIIFPQVEPYWVFEQDCVLFPALVDGQPIKCLVAMEALMQYFGAKGSSDEEFVKAFKENRSRIEEIAKKKIESAEFNPRGEVLILPVALKEIGLDDAITRDPNLKELVDGANRVLAEEIGRSAKRVTADWEAVGGDLLQLTLKDSESEVTAREWYIPSQLSSSFADFEAYRKRREE